MKTPEAVLAEAQQASPRPELGPYVDSIKELRKKKWSWREIADFLKERGVETDHTKLLRFMQKHANRWRVPDAEAYRTALEQLQKKGKLAGPAWNMLVFLYQAHNRSATYTELAQAAARGGARVSPERPHVFANLEFGKLGKTLGQALAMEFLPSSRRDAPFYSSSIGVGSSTSPEGGEFELVMHHELAKALDRLLAEQKSKQERSHE
jgi:hypothetical protein